MAMDGIFLHTLASLINQACPLKISKIRQPSSDEILFQCYNGTRYTLELSAHPSTARIQFTQQHAANFPEPTHFLTLLRKYCEDGSIESVIQAGFDRIVAINIRSRDELSLMRKVTLYAEMMGKYANLVLVNEEGIILDALRRIPPYENSRRIVFSGAPYTLPEQVGKHDPLQAEITDPQQLQDLQGFSPLLAKEFAWRMGHGAQYHDILNTCFRSTTLYRYPQLKSEPFHILELTHLSAVAKTSDIMEGLDQIYAEQQQQNRIREHTGGILRLVRRERKKAEQKRLRLKEALSRSEQADELRKQGDLLLTYGLSEKTKGKDSLTLYDDQGTQHIILLDPKLDLRDNAARYYRQYRKARTAVHHLEQQISLTEDKAAYFQELEHQIEDADLTDALEIRTELAQLGLLRQKPAKKSTGKKQTKPHVRHFVIGSSDLYVGKNNIQNDWLTFRFAHKNDLWFHVGQDFGAHVILKNQTPDETTLRQAAMVAAYFSQARGSSSIPVHYTQVRYLKKIPGAPLGKVSMLHYKTIYIDIDLQVIQDLEAHAKASGWQ